ncbi:MAG: alpha/beta hydrolase [Pseudohongiellaceae bacterium]
MDKVDYIRRIRSIGREVNPDTVIATRALLTPLVQAPDPAMVRVVRDLAYGSNERQRLDVYTPAAGYEPKRPILIYVHGGGFVAGDKHSEGSPFFSNIGQWAVQNGYNCITMTYRLAPQHQWPSGVEDLNLLLRFIRHEGNEHGLDSDCIFLMGQSAGAAHAASYVAHPEIHAPFGHGLSGLILLSGLYDWTTMDMGQLERSYIGDDVTLYEARSSLQGLVDCQLPLLVTLAELDPPVFERQGMQLLSAYQHKHQHLPHFVYAAGQNHMSVAMALGLEVDLVGPQLKAFIDEYSRYR